MTWEAPDPAKAAEAIAHAPECRWRRTTTAECEYRDTHHYCPHPEHACDCRGGLLPHPSREGELDA